MKLHLCCATILVLAMLPAVAWAQADVQAAEQAFEEAMELMKAKRYTEACAKFEKSQRIDAGMATRFRLAQCYERDGRIASAWKNYSGVAAGARAARSSETDQDKIKNLEARATYAQQRADALLGKVSKVQIQVPAEVASLSGLEVSIDGVVAPPSQWGGVPIDRGDREVVAIADGKRPWSRRISVGDDGERMTVRVSALEDAPPESAKDGVTDVRIVSDVSGGMHPVGIAGIVIGAVGVVGMGAGIALGVAAKSNHDDSAAHCNEADQCTPEGLQIRDDARTLGTIGTGVFIGGAVLAAGGFIMWLVAPSTASSGGDAVDVALAPLPGGGYGHVRLRF